ncbi:MAG: carbohydrate kinase family protein [bacterium]
MAKILTIGSVCKDMFFPTGEGIIVETPDDINAQRKISFELGAKYHIDERHEALGGISANVAVGLVKLGHHVTIYAKIGDDETGKWIIKQLKSIGVLVVADFIESDCQSDLSSILIDTVTADRVIFSNQIANQKLIIEKEKMGHPDWIFIGDLSGAWQKNIDTIVDFAKKYDTPIVFNPRQKTIHDDVAKIIQTISVCEILSVNKDEAIEIVHGYKKDVLLQLLNEEEYLLESLHEIGAKIVVLTDGVRGAWGYDGITIKHVAGKKQQAVDTTGAGDAFTSGFFAAHLNHENMEIALKWGIENSSNSITKYGGQDGLLDENQMKSLIKKNDLKFGFDNKIS